MKRDSCQIPLPSIGTNAGTSPNPPPLYLEIAPNTPDRPQEIYTMAPEVLLVAENSESSSGRLRWARWANGVISRVIIQPNMKPHKFLDLRAKCNLTMGTAKMEELLAGWDYPNVLHTDDAEDGREYFKKVATFFDQAITLIEADIDIGNTSEMEEHEMNFDSDNGEGGSGKASGYDGSDLYRMKSLRSEALIELGNLTADSTAREELYAEAKRVGGKEIVLDDEHSLDETE